MAVMQSQSERAERLIVSVETSYGSGDFQVDPRLCVEEVWQRTDDAVGRATISVLLSDAVDSEEMRRIYHPDRRLIVSTEHADPAQREILFEGYPSVQSSQWDGRVGREGERYTFAAEHVWERYNRAAAAWAYGRHVRSVAIEEGLAANPSAFADASVHLTAMPCIFNPDGVANRAAQPLWIARPDGSVRLVHVFAADGDASAVKWSFATALRYLVWFHLMREGPVEEGNIFDATDTLATGVPGDADVLQEALSREPVSLTCEAVSLVEALALLASSAGIHVTAECASDGGRPRTRLHVWSPCGGALRELYLVRGGRYDDGTARYDVTTRLVSEILRDNNTYRGQVTWDHRPIVNRAVVIGDVKRYEVTVPLWPGWRPEADLDNVPAETRVASKLKALTPERLRTLGEMAKFYEWYRKYHRDGAFYASFCDVSRLWVLNEDGAFDGATYNRNAPFGDYRPFDFASVLRLGEMTPHGWMRRVRPLRPALSIGADGQSVGVYVEVSFDSGSTWYPANGKVAALKDRAGIRFDCDNPTEITPPGVLPETQNMWYATVDQVFRVRVTAVIEGDDRVIGSCGPDRVASPTLAVNAAIVRRPQSFQFCSREAGGSVLYGTLEASADERDDSVAVEELAHWLAETRQDRQVRVSPVIPWVETAYAIGDRITQIRGRSLRFATRLGAEVQYPAVTERRFTLQDGRYETVLTLQATELPENAA